MSWTDVFDRNKREHVSREQIYARDGGLCAECGEVSEQWEADHKVPVYDWGGRMGLENIQTLCVPCHKEKTVIDMKVKRNCERKLAMNNSKRWFGASDQPIEWSA